MTANPIPTANPEPNSLRKLRRLLVPSLKTSPPLYDKVFPEASAASDCRTLFIPTPSAADSKSLK